MKSLSECLVLFRVCDFTKKSQISPGLHFGFATRSRVCGNRGRVGQSRNAIRLHLYGLRPIGLRPFFLPGLRLASKKNKKIKRSSTIKYLRAATSTRKKRNTMNELRNKLNNLPEDVKEDRSGDIDLIMGAITFLETGDVENALSCIFGFGEVCDEYIDSEVAFEMLKEQEDFGGALYFANSVTNPYAEYFRTNAYGYLEDARIENVSCTIYDVITSLEYLTRSNIKTTMVK